MNPGAFELWVTTGFDLHRGPHRAAVERHPAGGAPVTHHDVAVQVAFERHVLKPGFH
jgi:hypothetical protein